MTPSATLLQERIDRLYKGRVVVSLHENTTIYLRTKEAKGVLSLHLHHLFSEAPTPVLEAILSFAKKKDKEALRIIRRMAELYFEENPIEPAPLFTKGENYDLRLIYEQVKAQYFPPDYEASIGWSEKSRFGKKRSITFGSYDRQRRQIRIHRCLDSPKIPSYFIEFVVYHEMLHGVCLPKRNLSSRSSIHTVEFRKKEREFAQYTQAKQWEKANLNALLKGEYGRS